MSTDEPERSDVQELLGPKEEEKILIKKSEFIRTNLVIVGLVLLIGIMTVSLLWGFFTIKHLTLGNRNIGKVSNATLTQTVNIQAESLKERDARIVEIQTQNAQLQANARATGAYLVQLANELGAHGLPLPPVPTTTTTTTRPGG